MPLTDDIEALGLLPISVPCGVVLCLTIVAYDSPVWRIEELRLELRESAFFHCVVPARAPCKPYGILGLVDRNSVGVGSVFVGIRVALHCTAQHQIGHSKSILVYPTRILEDLSE